MSNNSAQGFANSEPDYDSQVAFVKTIQAYLTRLRRKCPPDARFSEQWEIFYAAYTRLFCVLVTKHGWSEADFADGVQELWLMSIRRLPELDYDPHRGDLRNWLRVVASRVLVDHERRRHSRQSRPLTPTVSGTLESRDPCPDAVAQANDLRATTRQALELLRTRVSERDYEAFVLRWLRGRSDQEVADALGMTLRQVRSCQRRTFCKLGDLVRRRLSPGDL